MKKQWQAALSALLAAWVLFTCFAGLGESPVRLWDESRQAMNTLEMLRSGNWAYTTFLGQPDFFNTKPPLLIWLQSASAALFGMNEWALRFPSALAVVAACFLLWQRWHKEPVQAFAGIGALLSSAYCGYHTGRTGDYDALLAFFLLLSLLAAVQWAEDENLRAAWILPAATALAFFTKSVAGLLFLPGIGILLLYEKKLWPLLKQKAFWLSALLSVFLVAAWYLLHEKLTPGYLQAVWNNEFAGRIAASAEAHTGPWWFYAAYFHEHGFLLWLPALAGLALHFRSSVLARAAAICGLVFLVLISISATKIEWYGNPAYLVLAIGYGYLGKSAGTKLHGIPAVLLIAASVVVWYLQVWPDIRTAPGTVQPGPEDELSLFLKSDSAVQRKEQGWAIVQGDYSPLLLYYNQQLQAHTGKSFPLRYADEVKTGDRVLVWHEVHLNRIRQQFKDRLVGKADHLHWLEIGQAHDSIP
jgi:4-amino-4-deoxy-L-arabinose transferase-like glycosyltransferase